MKKRIVLSLSLVLALAMMSLTAFAAAPKASVTPDKSSAKKGDTVVFEVELEKVVGSVTADVEATGLKITDVEADYYNGNTGVLILAYSGGKAASATFTCEVTGEVGEVASLRLTNVKAGEDTAAPTPVDDVYAGSVTIAEDSSEAPTDPEEPTDPSNPTDPAQPTDPANPTNPSTPNGGNNGSNNGSGSNNNQSGTGTANGNLDKAPNTGDATASVWPLVLIGCMGVAAAIVAGKKLAYRR